MALFIYLNKQPSTVVLVSKPFFHLKNAVFTQIPGYVIVNIYTLFRHPNNYFGAPTIVPWADLYALLNT